MDFESDPAAEFINREKEILGDLEKEITNDEQTSDDFVMVDNDIPENLNDNDDSSFEGMQLPNSSMTSSKEISEKIKLWEEQQAQMLLEKDEQEKQAIEMLRESGKSELENFYKTNQLNLEKTKANNRQNDSNINETVTPTNTNDNEWKTVYELCDFSQKVRNTKDQTRMKNILFQLKQSA